MNSAGPDTFGSPCRECGFEWTRPADEMGEEMGALVPTLETLLVSATGSEARAGLDWSITEYVSHVADNLRIWAERLAGARLGTSARIGSYDQDDLARARHYEAIPLSASLWSLRQGVAMWATEVEAATGAATRLDHPEVGILEVADVVALTAHDSWHHVSDIRGILARA